MKESKNPRLTDYIRVFAKESSDSFEWKYPDVFNKAVLATLIDVKKSNRFTPRFISNTDKILNGHSSLFKFLGMRFCKKVHESRTTELLLDNTNPTESPLFISIYADVLSVMFFDMKKTIDKTSIDKLSNTINLINLPTIVYCWHFLNFCENYNLLDKVVEELYLLREIEGFKNRKGE